MLNFELGSGNNELMEVCYGIADKEIITEEDASKIIVEALWEKMHESYSLKVIK